MSQKVVGSGLLAWNASSILRCRLEGLVTLIEMFIEFEDGRNVSAPIAVIWCRPDGDESLVEHVFETLHNELMSATNQGDFVCVVKLSDDIASKEIASASWRESPTVNFFGIRPEEIAHGSIVRDLLFSIDGSDLIERVDGGTESTVDAKDLLLNEGAQTEIVEDFGAVSPDIDGAILAQTFVIKAIDLSDLSRFVVSANQGDSVRIADLECQKQQKGLDAVESSINKIAHEEIVGVGHIAADFEKFFQVEKLAVNIATNRDGCKHALDVAFLDENLPRFVAQRFHLAFFDDFTSPQLLNLSIQI